MCGIGERHTHDHDHNPPIAVARTGKIQTVETADLLSFARHIVALPELRTGHVGFVGYGATQKGDRILLAVDTQYDPAVVDAVAGALREREAHVDVLTLDYGP